MIGDEIRHLERSFEKIKKICVVIRFVCAAMLVVLPVAWCVLILILFPGIIGDGLDAGEAVRLTYIIVAFVLVETFTYIVFKIFLDIVRGETPFTLKQITRIKVAALLVFVFALVDMVISSSFSFSGELLGLDLVFDHAGSSDSNTININLGLVLMSVGLYCVSAIFEYGVLLQQISDETL